MEAAGGREGLEPLYRRALHWKEEGRRRQKGEKKEEKKKGVVGRRKK
jgi:hypothetical protein